MGSREEPHRMAWESWPPLESSWFCKASHLLPPSPPRPQTCPLQDRSTPGCTHPSHDSLSTLCRTLNTLPPSNILSTPGMRGACFIHVCLLRNYSTVSDCEPIICVCWKERRKKWRKGGDEFHRLPAPISVARWHLFGCVPSCPCQ